MSIYNNEQEIFDKVWQTFIVEKAPQALGKDGCRYFLEGTKGCAVGCLMTLEDAQRADITSKGYGLSQVDKEIYNKYFPVVNSSSDDNTLNIHSLLFRLQNTHDGWDRYDDITFSEHMERGLRVIAKYRSLEIPQDA